MGAVPESVAVEARAKIFWGASPDSVLQFLKSNNVAEGDARALVEAVLTERANSVRAEGVTKIWTGALLAMLPVDYYLFGAALFGALWVKLFAALIVVGLFGIARLVGGISMVTSPRSVGGDLSNPDGY